MHTQLEGGEDTGITVQLPCPENLIFKCPLLTGWGKKERYLGRPKKVVGMVVWPIHQCDHPILPRDGDNPAGNASPGVGWFPSGKGLPLRHKEGIFGA